MTEATPAKKVAAGSGRLGLVAVCAVVLAAQALSGLLATNVKGTACAAQAQPG